MIGAYIGWAVLSGLLAVRVGGLHPAWVLPIMLLPAMLACGLLGRRSSACLPPLSAPRRDPARPADQRGRRLDLPPERGDAEPGRPDEGLHDQLPVPARLAVRGVRGQHLGAAPRGGGGRAGDDVGPAPPGAAHHAGRAIRAVAEDREMAAIMGVDVNRVVATTFFLGSALGGAAGVLIGLYYTQIDFFMGFSAGSRRSPRPCSAASATSRARCSAACCWA